MSSARCMQPYNVVRDFESELCRYTGAPFAVTTNSCTMALLLACAYYRQLQEYRNCLTLAIPRHTYVGVPMSIIHAGFKVHFFDEEWTGEYIIDSLPVWDSARRFTSGMYEDGQYQCVSFHASKILGDTQGGCVLHDNPEADEWLRKARFDGRTECVAPKDDNFILGYHCYMSPDVAARLLLKLYSLPKHNDDLPNDDYPDLSRLEVFQ